MFLYLFNILFWWAHKIIARVTKLIMFIKFNILSDKTLCASPYNTISNMRGIPKYIKDIEMTITAKLKYIKKTKSDSLEKQQFYFDKVLEIHVEAFSKLIDYSATYSSILKIIKHAYDNSLSIRDERISQFIIQDKVFGISSKKDQRDENIKQILKDNEELREQNLKLTLEISKMRKEMGKVKGRSSPIVDRLANQRFYQYAAVLEGGTGTKPLMPVYNSSLLWQFTQGLWPSRQANAQAPAVDCFVALRLAAALKDENFSDYLNLMRERDARYTLYFENLGLQLKTKELDGSSLPFDDAYGDPVVLRIALDRCREQLSSTQTELKKMMDEYSDTVPRRDYDILDTKNCELNKRIKAVTAETEKLKINLKRISTQKKNIEEELFDARERCSELERAGTPRPQWDLCSDFIGGGRDRWRQLARGLSSRDILRVLLKELGPAAESDHLEYFDGLGIDPIIPPYLRYEGKVRNLRLSRREISVIINDIWLGKLEHGKETSMQDYVTKYFEDRYQQPSVRAEWAYNLCAGVEQMLDEPQVKLFWGVLHSHLSEHIYIGHRAQWLALKEHVYKCSKGKETITLEDFEKIAKATFPLKSEVDIKNLVDVVRKQLKIKINSNEVNLDKLFYENEEGFDCVELARELYRQRQLAQDKYIREVVAELGGKHAANKVVTVENVKRAFAVVDPAIDHIRMARYIRWAFSDQNSELKNISPIPLRTLALRLAAGDIERVGPRYRRTKRISYT